MDPWIFISASSNTSPTREYLNYRRKVFGDTITVDGYTARYDGSSVVLISGQSINDSRALEAFSIALYSGIVENSIYSADSIFASFRDYANRCGYMSKYLGKKLYEVGEVYFNLTDADRSFIVRNAGTATEADLRFLFLLSSYLGRPVSSGELEGNVVVPVVKVSYDEKGKKIGSSNLTPIMKSFIEIFAPVIDFYDNESKRVMAQAYDSYISSSIAAVSNFCSKNLEDVEALRNYISVGLCDTKPPSLRLDDRSLWMADAVEKCLKMLNLYFNLKSTFNRKHMIKFIRINKDDDLQSINSLLISYSLGGAKSRPIKLGLADFGQLIRLLTEFRSRNSSIKITLVAFLDVLLLYLSIYGTSTNRIARYPDTFKVVVNSTEYEMDTSAVNDILLSSLGRSENLLRKAARFMACRTLKVRKMNNIKYNPFKTLQWLDPVVTFDFANYAYEAADAKEALDLSRLSMWIANASKLTQVGNASKMG